MKSLFLPLRKSSLCKDGKCKLVPAKLQGSELDSSSHVCPDGQVTFGKESKYKSHLKSQKSRKWTSTFRAYTRYYFHCKHISI